MRQDLTRALRALPLVVITLVAPGAVPGAEEQELGWSDTAELSYVVTGGNSETQTLGFKNTLERRWESSLLTVNAGGIRSESTVITRIASRDPNVTPSPVRVEEMETTELTAENYYLNGDYSKEITERFFWDAGAGWERNRFAGIENRTSVHGGVGNVWVETARARWSTAYSVTYTDQEDVTPNPDFDETYMGFRLSSKYNQKLGQTSKYANLLVVDGNADESEDLRADWTNSVTVSMTTHLALKVSIQLLYDAQPALVEVKVQDLAGQAIVPEEVELVELDELDSIFTASLVVNF